MKIQKKKRGPGFFAGIILGGFILLIVVTNYWLELEMTDLIKAPVQQVKQAIHKKKIERRNRKLQREFKGMIRKSRIDPSREYFHNYLYQDNKEIVYYKSIEDKIVNIKGNIPDGKAMFFNETKETYGYERYKKNQRHGNYKEYYANGRLRRVARYHEGVAMRDSIYYIDGTLRKEEDLTDALRLVDDPEVGEGKIYHRSGQLMYEWNLTNRLRGGYKKSYNIKGELTEEKRYDHNGQLVEIIDYGVNARGLMGY